MKSNLISLPTIPKKEDGLASKIWAMIFVFLDPKSLSNIAFVSRETRLNLSEILKNTFKEQRAYCTEQFQQNAMYRKTFSKYDEFWNQDLRLFNDRGAYEKLISQINGRNIDYFSSFFTVLLNDRIILIEDPKVLANQKNDLLRSYQRVLSTIQDLTNPKSTRILPSLASGIKLDFQLEKTQYHSNQVIQQFFIFINNLLKFYRDFQSFIHIEADFQEHRRIQNYLSTYSSKRFMREEKYSPNPKIYTTRTYFLKKGKSYFSFISPNLNQYICQFLSIPDLNRMRGASAIARKWIPQAMRNTQENILVRMKIAYEDIPFDLKDPEVAQLVERAVVSVIEKEQFQEQGKRFLIPQVQKLYRLFFKAIKQPIQMSIVQTIEDFHKMKKAMKVYNQDNEIKIVQNDDELMEELEEFFVSNPKINYFKLISPLIERVYMKLKVAFWIKKGQFPLDTFLKFSRARQTIKLLRKQQEHITHFFSGAK